jgi:hypothetical protein
LSAADDIFGALQGAAPNTQHKRSTHATKAKIMATQEQHKRNKRKTHET